MTTNTDTNCLFIMALVSGWNVLGSSILVVLVRSRPKQDQTVGVFLIYSFQSLFIMVQERNSGEPVTGSYSRVIGKIHFEIKVFGIQRYIPDAGQFW